MPSDNIREGYSVEKFSSLLDSLRKENRKIQYDIDVAARERKAMEIEVQKNGFRTEQIRNEWRDQKGRVMASQGKVAAAEEKMRKVESEGDKVRMTVQNLVNKTKQQNGKRIDIVDNFEIEMIQLTESLKRNSIATSSERLNITIQELEGKITTLDIQLEKIKESIQENVIENASYPYEIQDWVNILEELKKIKNYVSAELVTTSDKITSIQDDLSHLQSQRNHILMSN